MKGTRGALVEQLDGGGDLLGTDAEFLGDAMFDGWQHGAGPKSEGAHHTGAPRS